MAIEARAQLVARGVVFESPFGCHWCGTSRDHHGRQYLDSQGVHGWEQPTPAMILERMQQRRAARLTAEPAIYHAITAWAADHAGEEGIPYCADCKTDGCRKWMRIQDRLQRRRLELAGINPKRRSKKGGAGGGWGGGEPWWP